MMLDVFIRPNIARHWLLLAVIAIGCTKRNPDLCCTTDAECAAIGFSSHAPCDLGVCIGNECTSTGTCDDDTDCPSDLPVCIAGACTVCATSATCPASSPVCDLAAHDCRACIEDAECDSLACDIAAGTCVDSVNVLYTSPSGANTDPCTRSAPCSLAEAAQVVDTSRPYIVLLPGNHIGGAHFVGKTATIAGNSSTISIVQPTQSQIRIDNSNIIIRGIHFEEHPEHPDLDAAGVVVLTDAQLTVQNLESQTTNVEAIFAQGASTITIVNSRLAGLSVRMTAGGHLRADKCFFETDGPSVAGFTEMTNSILTMTSTSRPMSLFAGGNPTAANTITNNTIIGGQIICSADSAYVNSNIISNTTISNNSSGCLYTYNLFYPNTLAAGNDNIVGDPRFVDSTNSNFHLLPRSPAIDAADPMLIDAARDFDGTPRPQGRHFDIGAFEYQGQD